MFSRNSKFFIPENAFESVVCEKAAILSRPQWVKCIRSHYTCSEIASHGYYHDDLDHNFVKTTSFKISRCYHIILIAPVSCKITATGMYINHMNSYEQGEFDDVAMYQHLHWSPVVVLVCFCYVSEVLCVFFFFWFSPDGCIITMYNAPMNSKSYVWYCNGPYELMSYERVSKSHVWYINSCYVWDSNNPYVIRMS